MKILYAFLNYNGLTGSELYFYELSREMKALGHDVTICATSLGGPLFPKSEYLGINCEYPSDMDFNKYDIIHASHYPIVRGILNSGTNKPLVVTSHSEIINLETIPDHHKISKFIGIRPSIMNLIPASKSELIFNPVDFSRFNKNEISDQGYSLMVGSIDKLRHDMILSEMYQDIPQNCHVRDMIICGRNDMNIKDQNILLSDDSIRHLYYYPEIINVEDLIKKCSYSFGIIKGRTYIESMLCGKPYIDYRVDSNGKILKTERYDPSDYLSFSGQNFHKSEFDSKVVSKKIESIYNSII